MKNNKIDVELLKAMMCGAYDPIPENQFSDKLISIDLHRDNTKDNSSLTFQDQLNQFEKILDNAILNDLKQITLIHGKGAGVLRKELHKRLRKNKAIKNYHINRNNPGETIVYL